MSEAIILAIPVIIIFYLIGRWLKESEKRDEIKAEEESKKEKEIENKEKMTIPLNVNNNLNYKSSMMSQKELLIYGIISIVLYFFAIEYLIDVPVIGFFLVWAGWLVPVALFWGAFEK